MEDSIRFDGNAEKPRHISWHLKNSGSTMDKKSRSRTSRVSKQIVVVQVREQLMQRRIETLTLGMPSCRWLTIPVINVQWRRIDLQEIQGGSPHLVTISRLARATSVLAP